MVGFIDPFFASNLSFMRMQQGNKIHQINRC
jgi:hypothetical protein